MKNCRKVFFTNYMYGFFFIYEFYCRYGFSTIFDELWFMSGSLTFKGHTEHSFMGYLINYEPHSLWGETKTIQYCFGV